MVVLIAVAFLVLSKKSPDEPKKDDAAAKAAADAAAAGMEAAMEAPVPTPEPGPAMDGGPPKFISVSKVVLHAVGQHPEATPDEQQKIDALIQKAVFENAGADSRRAETELVGIGVKAAPRLINVFFTVKSGEGFSTREGLMKCHVADSVLRRIDGWIERGNSPRNTPISAASDPVWAERIMKMWTKWWDDELYKKPLKPWDERVDGRREDAEDKPAGGGATPPPAMSDATPPMGG